MFAIGKIKSSSPTSSPLINLGSKPFSSSCRSIKPPTYGLPPPPVPKKAVPLKKSSILSKVNILLEV